MMFIAGRSRGTLFRLVAGANICAVRARTLPACCATTPYLERSELYPTTAERPHAQAKYSKRFHAAYGHQRSQAGTRHHWSTTKSSGQRTDPPCDAGYSVNVTTGADARHRNLAGRSNVRTHGQSRTDCNRICCGHSHCGELRTVIDDNAARGSARQVARPFPRRLQPPSGTNSNTSRRAQNSDYEALRDSQN